MSQRAPTRRAQITSTDITGWRRRDHAPVSQARRRYGARARRRHHRVTGGAITTIIDQQKHRMTRLAERRIRRGRTTRRVRGACRGFLDRRSTGTERPRQTREGEDPRASAPALGAGAPRPARRCQPTGADRRTYGHDGASNGRCPPGRPTRLGGGARSAGAERGASGRCRE